MSNITLTHPIIFDREREYIQNFIEEQDYYCILNIFSPKGFGKSTFFIALANSYLINSPLSLVYVLDYCSSDISGDYNLDELLVDILAQLQNYLPNINHVKFNSGENQLIAPQLVNNIIDLVDNLSDNNKTTVILIDDYDHLPQHSRAEFEDIFLSRIIDSQRKIKVILSSGKELCFKDRLNLRIRLKARSLNTLDEIDIIHMTNQTPQFANDILKWSGGIPKFVKYIVDKTNEGTDKSEISKQFRSEEVIDKKYRSHINMVMFPESTTLSEEVIDVLALLRRFDVAILSEILPRIEPDKYLSFHPKDYFDLIQALGDRFFWRKEGGYALNSILRGMLTSYVRVFEPELSKKVNKITATTYRSWLMENFRVHYLTEMLFHQIELEKNKGTQDDEIKEIISEKILSFINNQEVLSANQLNNLDEIRNTLIEDRELRPYIKKEVFDALFKTLG